MPGTPNPLDEIANDLALWIDQTSSGVAYSTNTASGPHTCYLVMFPYSAGGISQYGGGFHTLYVTEQKR